MVKMRQQLEYLQAELCARGGVSFDEMQVSEHFDCMKGRFLTIESRAWSFYTFPFNDFHTLICWMALWVFHYYAIFRKEFDCGWGMQALKDRIAWLEATNEELSRELNECQNRGGIMKQHEVEVKVFNVSIIVLSAACESMVLKKGYALQLSGNGTLKNEGLKRGLQSMESSDYQMSDSSIFLYISQLASHYIDNISRKKKC